MDKIFTGKTIDDAVFNACEELGVSKDNLVYEILEIETKGLFGRIKKPASIKVSDNSGPENFISGYLKELFLKMGISDYEENVEIDGNIVNVSLKGDEIDCYTKRNTDIVEALQFILAVTVNKLFDGNYKITLNINDYREKSTSRLEALAVKTAKQVQKTKRKVTLKPMTPYQRRIIHSRLHDFENITTFSVGAEPNRKVVIAYDGPDRPLVKREEGARPSGKRNSERGGGRPFDPSGLDKDRPRRRNNGGDRRRNNSQSAPKPVEKVKVLFPGHIVENDENKSNFAE